MEIKINRFIELNRKLMIKHFLLIGLFLTTSQLNAQDFKIIVDEVDGGLLILGFCPASMLNDSTFNYIWTDEYNNYQPDYEVLDKLEGKLDSVTIKIVFRSTCSDSREQLPRLFKILNELNYNMNTITLIGVDAEKHGLNDEVEGLEIEFVPTIIFYKNGSEIGRIVEAPVENLEKDILNIVME